MSDRVLYTITFNLEANLSRSSHTFTRVKRIADESRRTRTSKTAFVVMAQSVSTAGGPRTFVHVVTPGAVRVTSVSFGTFAVMTPREVSAQ